MTDNSEFAAPHTLMVQGTTSDAGKSILVTALCRILARHTISVAPFKSQNMALNSAVTDDGGEIGRAQAVQANACYLPALTAMNPVLLKPNSDTGAQVIVNGRAIGNMTACEYHVYKPELLQTVVQAHRRLQQQYQVVIVEGAGSPAEINLREHDIANMGFAEAVDCPVIIVADIDRGGVFAHLYGTFALLSKSEQRRIKGFVINRFRGDIQLLEPGLDWLKQKTGVPVLAVIPYLNNLHIESEDSVAQHQQPHSDARLLNVVVIVYPRLSNHTDFDALRMHPQVDCQFIVDSRRFSRADLIILPGSKHVRADLQWLQDSGWQDVITRHRHVGGKVLGICGGFQMLGQSIHDPSAVESAAGSTEGLGLLSMQTTLKTTKTLRNVTGYLLDGELEVTGYEIHAGISEGQALQQPLFKLSTQRKRQTTSPCFSSSSQAVLTADNTTHTDGAMNADDSVAGTYIHGVFDQRPLLEYWLRWAGLDTIQAFDYLQYKHNEIDRLADAVEQVLPLPLLLSLLCLEKT